MARHTRSSPTQLQLIRGESETLHVHRFVYNRSYPIVSGSHDLYATVLVPFAIKWKGNFKQFFFQCGLARKSNPNCRKHFLLFISVKTVGWWFDDLESSRLRRESRTVFYCDDFLDHCVLREKEREQMTQNLCTIMIFFTIFLHIWKAVITVLNACLREEKQSKVR